MEEDNKFDDLVDKALQNAEDDRDRAIDAFEQTKHIFNIDVGNPETMQGLMLIGQNVSKLLDIANKSNEQIIKLAQLKKEKSKTAQDDKVLKGKITIGDLQAYKEEMAKEKEA